MNESAGVVRPGGHVKLKKNMKLVKKNGSKVVVVEHLWEKDGVPHVRLITTAKRTLRRNLAAAWELPLGEDGLPVGYRLAEVAS